MLHPSIATPILIPLTTIIQSNILHPCICSKAKRRIKRLENLKETNNLCIICELYAYGATPFCLEWKRTQTPNTKNVSLGLPFRLQLYQSAVGFQRLKCLNSGIPFNPFIINIH